MLLWLQLCHVFGGFPCPECPQTFQLESTRFLHVNRIHKCKKKNDQVESGIEADHEDDVHDELEHVCQVALDVEKVVHNSSF